MKKVDLLKIDTEGHELNVLNGALKVFDKNKIKYLLIEVHYSDMYKNYKSTEIHSFLKNKNFKLLKRFKYPFLKFEDQLYVNIKA